MKYLLKRVWVLTVIVALTACQSAGEKAGSEKKLKVLESDGFVRVQGTQFVKDGRPYHYVGTNFWYGAYLGSTADGRNRLVRELDLLQEIGINNLRILASSEQTSLTMAVNPAIHLQPGEYNESLLAGLDVLLEEMSKRDMRAVLYLNNFWQWSGGMSQYMAWLTEEPPFDPDVTGEWNDFMQNSAAFYRSDQAQEWYRTLIKTLVNRTNTVNGVVYRQDPTIMAWQLANEPRPGSDDEGRPFYPNFKAWVSDTARYIKELDGNHLVSTGNEGAMGTLRDIDLYADAHADPNIDYLTFHMWPKNWGWFDATRARETYGAALAHSKAYMLQHIQVAEELGKPTVLEEFGIERDSGDYRMVSNTTQRDRFFRDVFSFIEHQAKLGAPIAGSNFWTWGGLGRATSNDLIWREGDPFTGDPPQEPQGLNSVFDVDLSTIRMLSDHAKVMNGL